MDYYTILIFLTIMIPIVLIYIVTSNISLNHRLKKGFIITFIFIIIGAICEWYGEICNGNIWLNNLSVSINLHICSKILEHTIVPTMPVIFSKYIFEVKTKDNNHIDILIILLHIYYLIEIIDIIWFHKIFFVNFKNFYYHGNMYWIYTFAYIFTTIYMLLNAQKFSKKYQNENVCELLLIVMFTIMGIVPQFIYQDIKVCWITIAVTGVFSYIYYIGIIQNIDGLTSLLNKKSYHLFLENNIKNNFTVIIFDIDNFKKVNDKYGHSFGDKVLTDIAIFIREAYGDFGKCYRIGGDEFAVIILDEVNNIETLNENMHSKIDQKRKEIPKFPTISIGISYYNFETRDIQDIYATHDEADKNMYENKNEKK